MITAVKVTSEQVDLSTKEVRVSSSAGRWAHSRTMYVYKLKPEIVKWLKANKIGYKHYQREPYEVLFLSGSHAMMFKLKFC